MKRRTTCFHIYLGTVDWFIGIGITLLYWWIIRRGFVLLAMPMAYVIVASTGNWLKKKLTVNDIRNFRWQWGFQWPPQLFIGKLFYDGYHYVCHLGPVWIGREP